MHNLRSSYRIWWLWMLFMLLLLLVVQFKRQYAICDFIFFSLSFALCIFSIHGKNSGFILELLPMIWSLHCPLNLKYEAFFLWLISCFYLNLAVSVLVICHQSSRWCVNALLKCTLKRLIMANYDDYKSAVVSQMMINKCV